MNLSGVKLIEVGCDLVQFVRVEIAVDVRGDGRCRVAHGLLYVAEISAGFSGQAGVGVAKVVDSQRSQIGLREGFVPVCVPAPVVGAQHRAVR